jgi:hypothetical protein
MNLPYAFAVQYNEWKEESGESFAVGDHVAAR